MTPAVLAASTPAIVWLVIGLVTLVAIVAMLVALVRQGFIIGRAVRRLGDEVGPITAEIGARSPGGGRRPGARP